VWLTTVASLLSAITAAVSATIAYIAVRRHARAASSDAFMKVSDKFESEPFRKYRRIVYSLDRLDFESWSEETCNAVDTWIGFYDLVASLIRVGQIDETAFLYMYGDVTLRTIYQVSPYCNAQVASRGEQFELPFRRLGRHLITVWAREAASRNYPTRVGFPSKPTVKLNLATFEADEHIAQFWPQDGRRTKSLPLQPKIVDS
jgi:hypothetical protein